MKKIFKLSAALPFLLFATGCSDNENAPRIEGNYDVVVTVEGGSTRAADTMDGSALEDAFSNDRLFFGTYSAADGSLMDKLYEGTKGNDALNVKFFTPNWGPSISAKLPKSKYQDVDFIIGAYSLPENVTFPTFTLRGLANATTNELEWPGLPANNYVWAPDGDENQIPMSGTLKVTSQYMKDHYNEKVFGHTPMQLPNIPLQRVMAKIIIEDVEGIIEAAELKTPEKGRLVPFLPAILDSSKQMEPAEPGTGLTDADFCTQRLSAPNGDNNGVKQYIFYSYEWSFLRYDENGVSNGIKSATNPDREIITLYANAASGLKGTSRETTTVNFAPHVDNVASGSGDALRALDGGAWQGVMRNTVYTFRIYRPATGGVDVVVKAEPWTDTHREEFEF